MEKLAPESRDWASMKTLDLAGGVKVLERLASESRDWASMESV